MSQLLIHVVGASLDGERGILDVKVWVWAVVTPPRVGDNNYKYAKWRNGELGFNYGCYI